MLPTNHHRRLWVMGLVFLSALFTVGYALALEWEDPINAHPQSDFDDLYPRLATGPGGQLWLFWRGVDPVEHDRDIYSSHWTGTGWEQPMLVNPPNQAEDLPPQVSGGSDGSLWVLWTSQDPYNPGSYLGLTTRWTGSEWALPDTVWRNGARYEGWALAAVDQMEAWFVRDGASAYGSSDIFVYHHTGAVHDPAFQFVQPGTDEVIPTVTIDGAGNPWAAWHQVSPLGTGGPLQYSRRDGGTWTLPGALDPRGPIAPKLTTDSTGTPWIVTLADAPYWPTAADAWAVRWNGSDWDAPIRLSDAVLPLYTVQYQLSVSDDPGTNPVAIWVSQYAFSATRADLLCSRWTGQAWTPPELVGSLADSALTTWPDVSRNGGVVWAAYNRAVSGRNYVQNVFTIREAVPGDFANEVAFMALARPSSVLLKWMVNSEREALSFRIRRSSGGGRPEESVLVADLPGHRAKAGGFLDQFVAEGKYSYWIDFILSPGETVSIGPRSVEVSAVRSAGRLIGATPNSRDGAVSIRIAGADQVDRVLIFDVAGRKIRSLDLRPVNRTTGGAIQITWDGRTDSGRKAPAGVYFAKLPNADAGSNGARQFVLLR